MLYLIEAKIDYNLVGEGLKKELEKEWLISDQLVASGNCIAIWRLASGKGVIAVWNMPDHESVNKQITEMPLYQYMSQVDVRPLIAHPRYPQFAAPEIDKYTSEEG